MGSLLGLTFCAFVIACTFLTAQSAVFASPIIALNFSRCLIEKISQSPFFTIEDQADMTDVENFMAQIIKDTGQRLFPEKALVTAFITSMADVVVLDDIARNIHRKAVYAEALKQCSVSLTGYAYTHFTIEALKIMSALERGKMRKFGDPNVFWRSDLASGQTHITSWNPDSFNPSSVQPSPVQKPYITEFYPPVSGATFEAPITPYTSHFPPSSQLRTNSDYQVQPIGNTGIYSDSGPTGISQFAGSSLGSSDSMSQSGSNTGFYSDSGAIGVSQSTGSVLSSVAESNTEFYSKSSGISQTLGYSASNLPQVENSFKETNTRSMSQFESVSINSDTKSLPQSESFASSDYVSSILQPEKFPIASSTDSLWQSQSGTVLSNVPSSTISQQGGNINFKEVYPASLGDSSIPQTIHQKNYPPNLSGQVNFPRSDHMSCMNKNLPESLPLETDKALYEPSSSSNLPPERAFITPSTNPTETDGGVSNIFSKFETPPLSPENTDGEIFSEILANHLSNSDEIARFFCSIANPTDRFQTYFDIIKSSLIEYGPQTSSIAATVASRVLSELSKEGLCSNYAKAISEVIAQILDENGIRNANAEDILSKIIFNLHQQQTSTAESGNPNIASDSILPADSRDVQHETMPLLQSSFSTESGESSLNSSSADFHQPSEDMKYGTLHDVEEKHDSLVLPSLAEVSEYSETPVKSPDIAEISDEVITTAMTLVDEMVNLSSSTEVAAESASHDIINQKDLAEFIFDSFEFAAEAYNSKDSEQQESTASQDTPMAFQEKTVTSKEESIVPQKEPDVSQAEVIVIQENPTVPQKEFTVLQEEAIAPKKNPTFPQVTTVPKKEPISSQAETKDSQDELIFSQPTFPQEKSTFSEEKPIASQEEITIPQDKPVFLLKEPINPEELNVSKTEPIIPQEEEVNLQKELIFSPIVSHQGDIAVEEPHEDTAVPSVLQRDSNVPKEEPSVPREDSIVPREESIIVPGETTVPEKESIASQGEPIIPQWKTIVTNEKSVLPQETTVKQEELSVPLKEIHAKTDTVTFSKNDNTQISAEEVFSEQETAECSGNSQNSRTSPQSGTDESPLVTPDTSEAVVEADSLSASSSESESSFSFHQNIPETVTEDKVDAGGNVLKVGHVELQPSFQGPISGSSNSSSSDILQPNSDYEHPSMTFAREVSQIASSAIDYIRSERFSTIKLCNMLNKLSPVLRITPLEYCDAHAAIDYLLNAVRSVTHILKQL